MRLTSKCVFSSYETLKQTPCLEQWSAIEEEYSASLSQTIQALSNASLRLPLDADIMVFYSHLVFSPLPNRTNLLHIPTIYHKVCNVQNQVENKELAEALVVASKVLDSITQNVGNYTSMVSKMVL